MMVGRELTNNIYTKYNTKIGEVTLEVKNLTSADGRFKDISFQARQGEILGVAGLMGAGRSEVMAEALNGKGKINIVQGLLGHPANENRMTGIQTALKDYPDITINATQAADWDRAKAMNVTEDWLSGGGDFDGIIALNDEMAISVSNALTSAGKTGVKVVGIDAIDEALELVKSGGMAAADTVHNFLFAANAGYRDAVGHSFAKGTNIRSNTDQSLSAADIYAEAGDNLVHESRGPQNL